MPDESAARIRLRQELTRARDLAGISGRTMADRIGLSQGSVWRFEQGQQLLAMPKIRAWLDAAAVESDRRAWLLTLAEAVHGETRPWRDLLDTDDHLQEAARRRERAATLVQGFQPTIIPGLLQTPEYARRVFTLGRTRDVEAAVAARVERQQVLYDGTARFEFAIAERALRADLGVPALLAPQRDRVASLAGLDAVTVTIVPDSVAALPWHNFVVWTDAEGERYVTTELVHGAQELHDERDVAVYLELWQRLMREAVTGDEALAMLTGR